MKLKSYQSNSVAEAIRLAKVELGEDAIFMGSRENGPGDESSARYEVTFAVAVPEVRRPGGREDTAQGGSANESGGRSLRPPRMGLAQRVFGASREIPSRRSAQESVYASTEGMEPLASPRHWHDFVPMEMTVGRRDPQPETAIPKRPEDPVASGSPSLVTEADAAEVSRANSEGSAAPGLLAPPNNRPPRVIEQISQVSRLPERSDYGARDAAAGPSGEPPKAGDSTRSRGIGLLVSQGMCTAVATKLVSEALNSSLQVASRNGLQVKLELLIASGCSVDATLGRRADQSEPAVAAFVGPAGAGKTSTICKLAVRFGVEAGRPVHFVSLDPFRLGATEQLASFADLLNAVFTEVEDCGEMAAVIGRASSNAQVSRPPLVLIDTPGYGPAEWKQARSLARVLSVLPGLDTHVVVAATSSEGHLRRSLDAYRVFQPRKLLITKLDECAEAGAIVGETLRSRLPISFFSTGQRIPEDIAAATPERLAHQLLQVF